jgi:PAS domain S-box-containing protein
MNQPLNLSSLEQVIDYAPLIVDSDSTTLAAITLMNQATDSNSTHSPQLEYSYVLVVNEDNKPIGILTAGDVVRLTVLGTDVAVAKVTEVMSQPVVRSSTDVASDVLKTLLFMRSQHLDHLPIVDDQGRLLGMVTTRDLLQLFDGLEPEAPSSPPLPEKQLITAHEHRQHELELLSNQNRLEDFFSQSPDGFFFMMLEQPVSWNDTVDQEAALDHVFSHQKVTKVNAAMLAQYDATEDEFIGLTPADFFAHDLVTGRQLWREMFDQGRLHVETLEKKMDGTNMWVEGDYSCLYNSSGQIIGHFGIQRDISDRKRAAEELQQSQQDLTDFVENAIVSLHWVAADGTIIWANQTELDLLGYTREEYIGHSITEFHADQDTIADILQRLLSNQPVQEYEADLRCKDGSIRRVLIDSNSSWSKGEFVRTRCFTRDITDRKRAEEDLERFTQALSHAMEGIALLDLQGKYVQINHAYANTVGYTTEAMVGMDWQLTVHPEDLPQMQLAYQQMLEHGKVEVAARGLRSDGSIFYKQLVMVTAYDSKQQPIGHYCFMKDISTAKQAETDLIQSEQKFRAIFDGMFQFMGVLTPAGILIEANRTALDAIGVNPEDVVGQMFWVTPWWTHSPVLQEQLKNAIARAAQGELVRFEAEHILADQTAVFVDFTLKPIFDEGGKVIMLIPEGRDITDRKQAELELQNQKQDLARSNAELQQFAYVASHDLQEPLRMITSYLELLERRYKGQLDEKADKFIAYAVDGATRMQILINDLLSYSRVGTSGKDWAMIDCEKIVQNVLSNLRLAITQNNAIITHDALPTLKAESSQLNQLFQNLISNAIKFRREENPQIHIGVEFSNNQWLFSVQDNGIGMETQYLDRIFVIFQRLHSKTEYPGTGIGLAVCKKIVERHGGTLWVDSQPGQGSTFHFTIPSSAGNP